MYKCENCDYTSNRWFGLCPSCKDGIGVEYEDIKTNKQKVKPTITIHNVSRNVNQSIQNVVKLTCFDGLNKILSSENGIIDNQVILLGAVSGVGKSTICSQIADSDVLYISTEESYSQINKRFLRTNKDSQCDIACTVDYEQIILLIEQTKKKIIIIDSLNCINNGEWYTKQAKNITEITNCLKMNNKCGIITSHVTKSGEITGMSTILHTVDTVLYLERSLTGNNIILYSTKNRFGEIGSIAIFRQTNDGIIEVSEDGITDNLDPEIGCTICNVRFGNKLIPCKIEVLVAPTSFNFGIRSANGINLKRLNQIVGILSYYVKNIAFNSKDIYVGTRNGVIVNDTLSDLSIANSILSSLNEINHFKEISGELSLTGKVIQSSNDSIQHITDLINIYYPKK